MVLLRLQFSFDPSKFVNLRGCSNSLAEVVRGRDGGNTDEGWLLHGQQLARGGELSHSVLQTRRFCEAETAPIVRYQTRLALLS